MTSAVRPKAPAIRGACGREPVVEPRRKIRHARAGEDVIARRDALEELEDRLGLER